MDTPSALHFYRHLPTAYLQLTFHHSKGQDLEQRRLPPPEREESPLPDDIQFMAACPLPAALCLPACISVLYLGLEKRQGKLSAAFACLEDLTSLPLPSLVCLLPCFLLLPLPFCLPSPGGGSLYLYNIMITDISLVASQVTK